MPPTLRFSKNVLAQYLANRTQTFNDLVELNPNDALIMDDLQFAQALKVALPGCRVVHRAWNRDDAEFHMKQSAQWFVDAYCNVPPGIIVQYLNEPSGKVNLPILAHQCAEVMRLAHPTPIATPVFGLQNPMLDFGDQLDELILAFGVFRNCIWSQHIYFRDDPDNELIKVQHLEVVLKRFKALNVPVPYVQISEAGRDLGGGENDGWRNTGWSEDAYADRCIRLAERVKALLLKYKAKGGGIDIFCEGRGATSDARNQPQWRNFNTEGATVFHRRLVQWNEAQPDMTQTTAPPTEGGIPATLTKLPGRFVNIRAQPNGADVGDLVLNDTVTYFPNYRADTGWVYVQSAQGVGWVSLQDGEVAFTPIPEPPLPPNSPPINVEVAAQLAQSMEALAQDHAALVEKYRGSAALLRALFN